MDNNNNDDDDEFGNDDDWGDMELCYEEQQKIIHIEDEDAETALKRALEKRRIEAADVSKFWRCGKCTFLNHPSRAICMSCCIPQMDIIHEFLKTDLEELKICPRCSAYVLPSQYEDHILDCQPMKGIDNNNSQSWYCKLTKCEKDAITHVQSLAMEKSSKIEIKEKLLLVFKSIDEKYGNEETLNSLISFLEWNCPIIVRVHCNSLIPKLLKDTHYRNLFEIGRGSGGNDQNRRKLEEGKMFGTVYDKAKAFERPKYGCLNVGLQPGGCSKATSYGDGYFLMNDTTIRWRVTMTIQDSFAVNGNCGTLKHCNHLLVQLNKDELHELIEAALYSKKGGYKQTAYREIQIHGPVQLNRDIISLHVPNTVINKASTKKFQKFCQKNGCKLVWF